MLCALPSNSHKYLFTGNCTIFLKLFYWKTVLLSPFLLKLFAKQCLLIPAAPIHKSQYIIFILYDNLVPFPIQTAEIILKIRQRGMKPNALTLFPDQNQQRCTDYKHFLLMPSVRRSTPIRTKKSFLAFMNQKPSFLQLYSFCNSFTFHLN